MVRFSPSGWPPLIRDTDPERADIGLACLASYSVGEDAGPRCRRPEG
jgi:hypothetical protein